jgi:hypothetical protein
MGNSDQEVSKGDHLSNLASIVTGMRNHSPTKSQAGSQGETENVAVEGRGFSFPLLQQGGLTDEQLAAIQQSLGLTAPDVTQPDKHIRGDIPSFGVELPNQTMTQVGVLQTLNPEELEAIVSGQVHIGNAAPPVPEGALSSYKNWWDEEQEQELLLLVKDEDYRKDIIGSDILDWKKIAAHFDRTESALRKKIWLLTKKPLSGKSPAGRKKKRKWTNEENAEIEKIISDEPYRIAKKLQDENDGSLVWDAVAKKFGCDVGEIQKKFSSVKDDDNGVVDPQAGRKKREHHKKSLAYKWMIVAVMKDMPDLEGTALDIFKGIASNEEFYSQLDDTTAPGTARVPRWKIQIRKTLSAESIFVNTGKKVKRETVWKLDIEQVEQIKMRPKQRTGQSIII